MKLMYTFSFSLFLVAFLNSNIEAQTIRYVKATPTGSGDGSSWANASDDPQDLINASTNVTEIWVAEGTYKPTKDPFGSTTPADPRNKTFYLKNGVKLYGGFAGTESLLSERNWVTHPTILSGDFRGDDVVSGSGSTLSLTNNGENAYHVVLTVSNNNTTVLDGFTVKGGNANGSSYITLGVYVNQNDGGGIYNNSSSPTISNTTFSSNYASYGGGMNNNNSSPTISNTTFSGNYASSGGGIYNYSSSPTISNTTFSDNYAQNDGGGMYNYSGFLTISNTTFSGNSASYGGGMRNDYGSPTISNTTFSGNYASSGGGMYNFFVSPTISNSIIWGNTDWGNQGDLGVIMYSIVQGTSVYTGIGNSNANPLFKNAADPDGADNIWRTADDGLQLSQCSPAFNAGNNVFAPTSDILGATRPQFSTADMGAYESTINLYSVPAPIANAQTVCINATVANLVATGTDIKWYSFEPYYGFVALHPTTLLVSGTTLLCYSNDITL
jgi:hypothetical protein